MEAQHTRRYSIEFITAHRRAKEQMHNRMETALAPQYSDIRASAVTGESGV